MISSEVQRTLVKSPPELWAELSDPAALARHLGELGEIRITKAKPEQSVEWEAETAKGTVDLKPSGWGTKVTLTVTRELPAVPDPASASDGEGEADAGAEPAAREQTPVEEVAQAEPEAEEQAEPEAEEQAEAEPETQAEAASESDVEAGAALDADSGASAEQEPTAATRVERVGFFARLLGRLRRRGRDQEAAAEPEEAVEPETTVEPEAAAEPEEAIEPEAAEPEAAEPEATEPEATEPEATGGVERADAMGQAEEDAPATGSELSAELQVAEEAIAEQTTQMLTAVLDRLGAAHHRPFSRG